MDNLILIIGFGAILQGLFLSLLYIFSKKHSSRSNKFLGLFLFALIWEGVNSFLPINEIGDYSIGYYFELPESKLFMPLFFFNYIVSKINREDHYSKILKIGYVLAFSVVALTLVNLTLFFSTGENLRQSFGEQKMEFVFLSQQVVAYLLSVLAFVFSIIELRKVRAHILDNYSDPEKSKFNWLWRFVFLFVPMIFLWGLELSRIFLQLPDFIENFVIVNWFFIFVLLYYISYRVFSEPDVFSEFAIPNYQNTEPKLSIEPNLIDTIESAMQEGRFYSNSDLLLHELSKELNISSRKISDAIKEYRQTNFSTWVNTYRVNEAIQMINSNSNLSIEGIGQEVGFKSRSAMYTAFKKIKGKTPGEFK